MTLSDAPQLALERLGPSSLAEIHSLLDPDPVLYVYLHALILRDALARPADEFWGVRRGAALAGLYYLGASSGAVLPATQEPSVANSLAAGVAGRAMALPARFQVIGPRVAVGAIVERLGHDGISPRVHRPQRYLALRRADFRESDPVSELRPARPTDYRTVFESGAALRAEELGEDPRDVDASAYARRVEEECRDGHTWVGIDDRGLRFRASISALTPEAAQVSGVYVPPALRNRGIARRGLAAICARLFERSQAVCLFVNDFNAPAIRVYHHLGFSALADWASAFYDRRPDGPPGPAFRPGESR